MGRAKRAVLLMEEDPAPGLDRPLMLKTFLTAPVLAWMGRRLLELGVERIFLACSPQWEGEARACLPEGLEAVLSDRREELMAFLDTEETVLVLNRSALPLEEAGAGFAYAASGEELRQTWRERLTNAVQGAELAEGWLPLFGPETLEELEPLFRDRTGGPA